jgi:hypothetical protein
MANSLYIPLRTLPVDLVALREIVSNALADLGIGLSGLTFKNKRGDADGLLDDFVLLDGNAGQKCWISFSQCSVEISEREGYGYLADVQTRDSWDFAGGVAYALCAFAGYVVFNDAGELSGQERYTAEGLRRTLLDRRA